MMIPNIPLTPRFIFFCLSGVVFLFGSAAAAASSEQEQVKTIARSVAGDTGTSLERAGRLLSWMHDSFEWTENDYAPRTVEEILERRAGHCGEMAWVLKALLEASDVPVRVAKEINVHPPSEERRSSAEDLIAKHGDSLSVFGYAHNDHRWLEVYDETHGDWIPADPTLDVFGTNRWIEARLGFGERPEAGVEMIVPFVVLAVQADGTIEDRSSHYLIEEFNAHYGGGLSRLAAWPAWIEVVDRLSQLGKAAFDGEVNLHRHDALIDQAKHTYQELKEQYLSNHKR